MQDPEEDTEWNDILRAKGILPPKAAPPPEPEPEPDRDIDDLGLDKLMADFEADAEDDRALQEHRRARMAELQRAAAARNRFGSVLEISAKEYKREINEAGPGIWVVLVLYKQGILVCRRLLQIIDQLAAKFPATKFVKSISTTCIPNYPDQNLPTIFVYHEGDLKHQWVGPFVFGGEKMVAKDVELALGLAGAVELVKVDGTASGRDDDNDDDEPPRTSPVVARAKGIQTGSKGYDQDESDGDD